MEAKINNSVVATDNSTISGAAIKSSGKETTQNSNIENSVVAQKGSQITNANIDITKEKRKSFWNGVSIGGIIMSVVASAIWYIIQKYFIE
jgi:hypothetical protein